MKYLLTAALSAVAIYGTAFAMSASAQETVTGAPAGTAPATVEGYGPSSVIVCDEAGTTCWHSLERYDYPQGAGVVVHPYGWRWNEGDHYVWREHAGRGYWRGSEWEPF